MTTPRILVADDQADILQALRLLLGEAGFDTDLVSSVDGVLASGTFTAANLVGPLAGHPLSELISAMRSGGAYVNVHTNDGVAPTNTGPGDFPGGEIRGQLAAPGKM